MKVIGGIIVGVIVIIGVIVVIRMNSEEVIMQLAKEWMERMEERMEEWR